jgi:predicted RNase H-like HicB family nuclease
VENYIKTDGFESKLEIQLNVLVIQQGDYYVALCPALNLSSYGNSIEDAQTAFDEAVQIYFEEGIENNTIQQDLIKNGWSFLPGNLSKAKPPKNITLDIPSGLLRTQYNTDLNIAVC